MRQAAGISGTVSKLLKCRYTGKKKMWLLEMSIAFGADARLSDEKQYRL